MLISSTLLPVVALAALQQAPTALAGVQEVLSVDSAVDPVLSPDVVKSIQSIVDEHQVPGLSLAFVRPGGSVEYGNWGIRSEDGDAMTSDVGLSAS